MMGWNYDFYCLLELMKNVVVKRKASNNLYFNCILLIFQALSKDRTKSLDK